MGSVCVSGLVGTADDVSVKNIRGTLPIVKPQSCVSLSTFCCDGPCSCNSAFKTLIPVYVSCIG